MGLDSGSEAGSAERLCGTCRFWANEGPEHQPGQCRRHAPTHSARILDYCDEDKMRLRWPIARVTDWCGEHKAIEAKLAVRALHEGEYSTAPILPCAAHNKHWCELCEAKP